MSRRSFGPGPAAYMLPSAFGYYSKDQTGQRSPGYTLGSRTHVTEKDVGPGPGAYRTDALTRYGKSRYYSYSPRT